MTTTFSGPVVSTNGFVGALTGSVTGNVTGNVTGAVTGSTGSFSGALSLSAGTVSLPGLTFTGDTNCGVYRIGADNIGVACAGAKVLDIAAAGLAVTGLVSSTTTVTAGTNLVATSYIQNSVGAGLTAAGTTRADALQLAKAINVISTAAASTGVILPSAATVGVGGEVIVFNAGANAVQVYGAGSDTIDGVAGSTGVPLTNAKRCSFFVTAANTYISAQLGVVSA